MKEHGLPFSAEMVRPILAGRKTQTRRIAALGSSSLGPSHDWKSPYRPGEKLWVREACRYAVSLDHMTPKQIGQAAIEAGYPKGWAPKIFEADGITTDADLLADFGGNWGRYRHARFMPRWASRITLRITDVRAERLQDISGHDALAEGVVLPSTDPSPYGAIEAFSHLWESLNAKRAPWDSNPWVWVIQFERVDS